ncbi:MAG: glutamate-5-semialdehyde dehydrogenase [Woeseiaceae bacterium]|tara:strand:+ start:521 stop:1786 length:1266 start_codon:yes stop_codon:yes gene_type:complete
MDKKLENLMIDIGRSARDSSYGLAKISNDKRNKAIFFIAESIENNIKMLLEANARDIESANNRNLSSSLIDRLMLNEERIFSMASSMRVITEIPDPINQITEEWSRPNGLIIKRLSVPLGVIGIIYESRPNVTCDAAALCIKSGNTVILRGGSESFESNKAIHFCLKEGIKKAKLDESIVQLVPTRDRDAVGFMLSSMNNYIDVVVPRGGKNLVRRVQDEARIPVIGHLEGICHIYVHHSADFNITKKIILNAKMRRTGICGAAETILIDKKIAPQIVSKLADELERAGCEIKGDHEAQKYSNYIDEAIDDDWSTEYLDAIISMKIVDDIGEAIKHIAKYGSGHTDSIISSNQEAADKFIKEIDSAIVMHNTSTQFADGGEFGMGAEIGIATGKIHARGPVGANQLTSYKYAVFGNGQVRP